MNKNKEEKEGGVEGEEEGETEEGNGLRKHIQILFLLRSLILEIQTLILNPSMTSFGKINTQFLFSIFCFLFFYFRVLF